MKIFKQLNHVEKAKLLHQWFPDEIPAFLETMQGMCTAIGGNEAEYRGQWDNTFYDFDFWLQLVRNAAAILEQYSSELHKNSSLFADGLFDGYQALFSVHCLRGYALTRQLESRDFYKAFDLFFHA